MTQFTPHTKGHMMTTALCLQLAIQENQLMLQLGDTMTKVTAPSPIDFTVSSVYNQDELLHNQKHSTFYLHFLFSHHVNITCSLIKSVLHLYENDSNVDTSTCSLTLLPNAGDKPLFITDMF